MENVQAATNQNEVVDAHGNHVATFKHEGDQDYAVHACNGYQKQATALKKLIEISREAAGLLADYDESSEEGEIYRDLLAAIDEGEAVA